MACSQRSDLAKIVHADNGGGHGRETSVASPSTSDLHFADQVVAHPRLLSSLVVADRSRPYPCLLAEQEHTRQRSSRSVLILLLGQC